MPNDDHQTRTLTYHAAPIQWTNWTLPGDARVVATAAVREHGGEAGYVMPEDGMPWEDNDFGFVLPDHPKRKYEQFAVTRIGIKTYEVELSTDPDFDKQHETRPFGERLRYYMTNVL